MENFKFEIYRDFFKDICKINNNFVISGSCSAILHLNKVHRICNDIDIHFEDDCDILKLITLINKTYNEEKYTLIHFKDNLKNKEAKLLIHKPNKKYEISLDIYTNSYLDYDIIDGVKIMKLERLISNKLKNLSSDSNEVIIKNLYDLQFLIELNYEVNLIYNYLTKDDYIQKHLYKIDDIINNDYFETKNFRNNLIILKEKLTTYI